MTVMTSTRLAVYTSRRGAGGQFGTFVACRKKHELIERYACLASILEVCQTLESELELDASHTLDLAADDLLSHILTCRICRLKAN